MGAMDMAACPENQVECADNKQEHPDYQYGGDDEIRNTALHDVGDDRVHEENL